MCAGALVPLCLVCLVTAACAGPPYATDDPDTTGVYAWELDPSLTIEHTRDDTTAEVPRLDVSYGCTPNLELGVDTALVYTREMGGPAVVRRGNTTMGIKWRLRPEGRGWPRLAIAPQCTLPTGSGPAETPAARPSYDLTLLAGKDWGGWFGFGGGGYVMNTRGGGRSYWHYGIVLQREVVRGLLLGAEFFGNSPTEAAGGPVLGFNAGGEWSMGARHALLFSAGRDLHGGALIRAYLGVSLVLGPLSEAPWPPQPTGLLHPGRPKLGPRIRAPY